MGIVRGMISPHPPIIVPEVGGDEVRKVRNTVEGMKSLADVVKETVPEVVIVVTPHGAVFQDGVAVTAVPRLTGSLSQFGAEHVQFDFTNDMELVEEIIDTAAAKEISVVSLNENLAARYGVSVKLDHGIMVPLYFLKQAGVSFSLVPVSMGFLPFEELYRLGTSIREAAQRLGRRVLFLASGDLSHRLTPDAPAGYNPRGKEYDTLLVDLVKKGDVLGILRMDEELAEAAGECGLRSFIIMLGAFDGMKIDVNVLSYEGPFGVGYFVADIIPGGSDENRRFGEKIIKIRQEELMKMRGTESEPVFLARKTLEAYIKTGNMDFPPAELKEVARNRAGVFVSIKKHGQLRGCIGTIEATQPNVAEEIMHNAISAGTRDPRFNPVTGNELNDLVYSVDVLYPPEPISSTGELDPQKYGVIIRSGYKSGLLLPNLEGVDTVEEQVEIAKRKAGIGKNEPVKLERFEVVRYH